jgi:very-short-patch-repair endonuclease
MLYLVTSLQPGDVKAPGNSRGKEIFHKYLHYSADPNKNLIIGNAEGDPDSDFEVFVANKIRQYGYEVDYQIGVNGFKIDLGIRDPRDSSVYIAGIECDGATFHSSPQARDRDILRQEILEDYGWRIFRIWSTDWFRDSDGEIAKLMSWLKDIRDPVPSSEPTSKEIDGSELKLYNEGDGSTAVWCNSKYVCTILKLERRDSYAANLLMSRREGKGFHATSKLLSYYMIEGIDELEGKEYGTYNEAEKASVSYLRSHLK